MKLSMVVAAATNNAIGLKGKLLWNLPKDMDYFRNITLGHYVLMGRKSWEALPAKFRPLPGRTNIVVTRHTDFNPPGAHVAGSIDQGVQFARDNGEAELMIIGGGDIYQQALEQTDTIYLTRVHHSFPEADAFFPELDTNTWRQTNIERHNADKRNAYDFDFVVYQRIS
jgi:dihydrofolate reductase